MILAILRRQEDGGSCYDTVYLQEARELLAALTSDLFPLPLWERTG